MVVILDHGSYKIKAGFGQENGPRLMFESLVYYRDRNPDKGRYYVGKMFNQVTTMSKPVEPFSNGIVSDWIAIEKTWEECFEDLNVIPSNENIILTDIVSVQTERARKAEILFETFGSKALYIMNQEPAQLYSTGRVSGVVLNIGYELSHTLSISEGQPLPQTVQVTNIGGKHINQRFHDLIKINGKPAFSKTTTDVALCALTFEEVGTVAIGQEEFSAENVIKHELPDGTELIIRDEARSASELLFDPSVGGSDARSVVEILRQSISPLSKEIHSEMLENIIIGGGIGLLDGISKRLEFELTDIFPVDSKIKVPERRANNAALTGTFVGCSAVSVLHKKIPWLSKAEFEERGNLDQKLNKMQSSLS